MAIHELAGDIPPAYTERKIRDFYTNLKGIKVRFFCGLDSLTEEVLSTRGDGVKMIIALSQRHVKDTVDVLISEKGNEPENGDKIVYAFKANGEPLELGRIDPNGNISSPFEPLDQLYRE